MNADTMQTTFSGEDQEILRAEARQVMGERELSIAAASKEAGIGYSTLSAWMNGSYGGSNDRVAADVQRWLRSLAEKKKAAAKIASSPGFQETPTAVEFLSAFQYAQIAVDFTVVVGGPGVGKTTALHRYQQTTPNVWMVTMEPTTARPNPMLQEICAVMEVEERGAAKLSRAIGKFVAGKNGLLAIDEGQHLTSEALDQLRSLHDRYGLGIVVCGNEKIIARLEGQKASFAQLYSRVGVRMKRPKPRLGDISTLIEAWGVTAPDEVKLLKGIGSKPGGLRSLDKCMRLASTLASGAREERGMAHIRTAWDRLAPEGGNHAE